MKLQTTREVKFINDFFKSEKVSDGSTIITILKDERNFFGINLEGCELITDNRGYIIDKFTNESLNHMREYLSRPDNEFKNLEDFKKELKNRTLNVLISQIIYII